MGLHGIITSFTSTIIQCPQAFLFSLFDRTDVNHMTNAMKLSHTRHSEHEMTSSSTWRNLSIDHQGTQRLLAYGHADVRKRLLAQSLFCLGICFYVLYFGTQNEQTSHRIYHCATRDQDSERVSWSNKCGVPRCNTFAAGRSKWIASVIGAGSVQVYGVPAGFCFLEVLWDVPRWDGEVNPSALLDEGRQGIDSLQWPKLYQLKC